jgi:Trk K+ transport system NAD-binding subunit
VVVAGLHDVGLHVIEQLHSSGERVVVIDDGPDQRLLRMTQSWNVPHVNGNPRREATLAEASLHTAAALICLSTNDLHNLEVALLARRLYPNLRVITQLSNTAVGRAVERVTGHGTVLDVATLAAPTLAEACLALTERPLDVEGEAFVLRELTASSVGTLRMQYGDLAPIAVMPADGTDMLICPGRDHVVVPGDRIVVVGIAEDVDELAAATSVRRRTTRTWRAIPGYAMSIVSETDRALRLTLAVLAGVAALSVLLLSLGYQNSGASGRSMSLLDAVYFTTETLTTVGFGDFFFADQPVWLRIWAVVLMIVGAAVVTVVYALLTNFLVSRRIAQSLGRQVATSMSDHVIVIGLGSVGIRVLELLVAAGQHAVVLERDEDNRHLANARALNVPVVIGDSTVPASLSAVNLSTARAVAVLTSSDLANIETGLAVDDLLEERRAGVPVVLRIFDRELARTVETSFGFHHVRSTAALAAPWFVGAALGLHILTTFYVDQQPMLISRLVVAESGGLAGKTMFELSARIRVIAIKREDGDALEYPPRRDTRFQGGDHAYLVGPYEEILDVLRRDRPAVHQ